MSHDDDHYRALDVAPDADAEEIRAAWRFMLVAFHPDRFRDAGQRARAQEITKRANAAWQELGDPDRRRRYDRRRAVRAADGGPARAADATRAAAAPAPPPVRTLPCPSCATRCTTPDALGRMVHLVCPACREDFTALIGGRCIGRPRLEKRWLGLRYEALFRAVDGSITSVSFRRLPQELALSEGELFTIVFHPRRARPVYAILHGGDLDVGWKVG
ncbi:MAG: J domain-containing protein [Thermoleophilia bacterium]